MKYCLAYLVLLSCALKCVGQIPLIDFSEDNSVERIIESGIEYTIFEGRNRFIRIEDQDVKIRFPGGRAYELRVDRGSFDLNDQNRIVSSRLITELMPTQEAGELMRIFKRSFAARTSDVDRWFSDVQEEKHKQPLKFDNMGYGTGIGEHYPKIQLISKRSQNPTYEWNFVLNLEWHSGDYPEGWNEEKAAVHNPKPPSGYEVVSLNPPSGRFYSRKEGFEIAYGIDLDQQSEADTEGESEHQAVETEADKPRNVTDTKESEEPAEQSSKWWLWLIGGLLLVSVLALIFRRRS